MFRLSLGGLGLAPLRGSLRYSLPAGAAQLGPKGPQTVLAPFPPEAPLLGAAQGNMNSLRSLLSVFGNSPVVIFEVTCLMKMSY